MKKSGLFKIILILILVVSAITWLVPASYYSGSEIAELGMNRIGFFDFFNFVFSSIIFKYFLQVVLFILSIGGLYGVLVKTNSYKAILEKITKSLKGKETIFLVVVAFLFAGLSSAFGFQLIMFIFIPALISIILLMGYSKFTAYLTTFGAITVGIIGSTINDVNLQINTLTKNTLGDNLVAKLILFAVSFALLMVFTLRNAKKEKKSKNKEESIDLFLEKNTKTTKGKVWPIYTLFGILFVIVTLSCIYWADIFKVNIFTNALTKINEFDIKGVTIFRYILGEATAFGQWSYFELSTITLVLTLIIGKIYKVKTFDAITEGVKKLVRPALLVLFAYIILYIAGNTLFYNTLMSYVVGLFKHLSVAVSTILITIGSALHIDFIYTSNYVLPIFVGTYTKASEINTMAILAQSVYGLTMLVAPTSIMLILGLEYLDIPYKKWLQFIWKFIIALLIVILLVALIVRYL